MFLRNFLKSKSKDLENMCKRPKIGLGDNFWQIKSINDKLDMKKNISKDAFDNKSFKKETYNFITKK